MRSKIVTDSLLQIALLLSLLRSNVDEYLHLFSGYSNEHDMSDVILGDASAIVQTNNHHNQWDRSLEGFSHPKNIERLLVDYNIPDLYRQSIQPAEISTYLLPVIQQTEPIAASSNADENSNSSPAPNTNNNNNNNESYNGDSIALQWQADSNSEQRRRDSSSSEGDGSDLSPEVLYCSPPSPYLSFPSQDSNRAPCIFHVFNGP